jgi:hypothetical protein
MSNFTGYAIAGLQLGLSAIIVKPNRRFFNILNPDGSALQDIKAQATVKEIHNDELEVTEHPVEVGAMISDHAFKRPVELVLEIAWSNSPSINGLLTNAGLSANQAAGVSAGIVGATAVGGSVVNAAAIGYGAYQAGALLQSSQLGSNIGQSGQINSIYDQLRALQTNRALFSIQTGKRLYNNMICKSLVVETDQKSENALFVIMNCKEVILVNSQTVLLSGNVQADPGKTESAVPKGNQNVIPYNSVQIG